MERERRARRPLLGRHRRGPLDVRFWRAVEKADGDACWLWRGSVNTWGYGQIRDAEGTYTTAHRVSWQLHHGPIPDGFSVLHRCDVPRCVRPDHLFLGDQRLNIQDKVAKGRQAAGERHGHAILTTNAVESIRQELANGDTLRMIAERHGVSHHTISDIKRGKSWHAEAAR